uniref:Sugar phosphate transporter domain-containing protein n=1 Tax=Coccolithus braarudii TaxID=221442 RepID=A0A7S0LHM6_9EUKA
MGGRTASENALDLFSYAVSFGAFYVFVFFAKRVANMPSFRADGSKLYSLISSCVVERMDPAEKLQKLETSDNEKHDKVDEPVWKTALHLAGCVLGIQVSYLLWGLMQERIMTKPYATGELFRSSKFLVFANRFLALIVAWVAYKIQVARGDNVSHGAPLYIFSYSSVSNILSSVCQYEALKFVSFPTQVLSKSCKMVPVMLMGYVVSRKQYSLFEYLVAAGITSGAAIFKLYEKNDAPVQDTEFVGIMLILGYMVCDSFTSNWQSRVFKQYGVGSISMMMYANMFSSGFTALGLLVTLEIIQVVDYMVANPLILNHMLVMAICSAVGQLFIFHTIKQYGPLVFATIQTVRQLLSIVLSILFFAHPVNNMEALGIGIVFLALGAQIAQKWHGRKKPKAEVAKEPVEVRVTTSDDEQDSKTPAPKEVQSLLRKSSE